MAASSVNVACSVNADRGIHSCGKYGISQTSLADVVEKSHWEASRARMRFCVGTILGRYEACGWKSFEPSSARRDMVGLGWVGFLGGWVCVYLGGAGCSGGGGSDEALRESNNGGTWLRVIVLRDEV